MKKLHPVTEDLILGLVLMSIIILVFIIGFSNRSLKVTAVAGIIGLFLFFKFRIWFLR